MSTANVPYINAYGNITKALKGIITAQTPPRFTHDFLSTKLNLSGGSARPVIPFLKKTGFLASDGSPTSLYQRFRNEAQRGAAAAEATRMGYSVLYEHNEYVHDLSDADLKGVVIQATGAEDGSTVVKSIVGSFKALKAFASFDHEFGSGSQEDGAVPPVQPALQDEESVPSEFRVGYTINLNLPATSDVAVFNAIFSSLREHLLPRAKR